MFGLDDKIATFSDGTTLALVLVVSVLLGLRHAGDPDHVAAVATIVASGKERTARLAARLGLAWGLGHGATLFAFGLPILLYEAYLPDPVQSAAETFIGFVIVLLAVWLLARWRRGYFADAAHAHEGDVHAHVHARAHAHGNVRSPWKAFAVGLVHGMGGSAGVGILLLAAIPDRVVAVTALGVFAFFTAVSMALISTGFGLTLGTRRVRRSLQRVAPALGVTSLAFGFWYALGAQGVVPYAF